MDKQGRSIVYLGGSGVQRLLDARGQRGSWMPSKIFSIHPAKFQTNFFISCQMPGQFAPWMPPLVLPRASVTTFFSSFFAIYLHFLYKTGPLDAPRVDARCRRTVRTPLCTPLLGGRQLSFGRDQLGSRGSFLKRNNFVRFMGDTFARGRIVPHVQIDPAGYAISKGGPPRYMGGDICYIVTRALMIRP